MQAILIAQEAQELKAKSILRIGGRGSYGPAKVESQ
jgi:hypothetical protein